MIVDHNMQYVWFILCYLLIGALFALINAWHYQKFTFQAYLEMVFFWPVIYFMEFWLRTFYEIDDNNNDESEGEE